ncbi:MAG: YvcK family protein, partial [bacterium]|nr:YvcK family protein [bacterium]
MKKIVTIGGGTGQFALLTGLKTIPDLDITAVVTMADSGGSSGVLRTERGVLPPGDIIRCLLALATADEDVIGLFHHRLTAGGGVGGHRIGNLALTGAVEQRDNDFLAGVATISKVLAVRGRVLPVTIEKTDLCARLSDGSEIRGEHRIDHPEHDTKLTITDVWLDPPVSALAEVREAILHADAVVAGPGDLYTSIVPNLLVGGMHETLRDMRAKLVFVINAMTKRGETDGFTAREFATAFERYAQRTVDVVVCNTKRPEQALLARYGHEGSRFVPPIDGNWNGRTIVRFPLLGDGPFARHDP